MLLNKAQTCSFLGWTSAEFDRNVSRGFPARKTNRSRGTDWQIDSREAVAWVVEQEAASLRPRSRPAPPDFSTAPPGWVAFRSVEKVESPVERASMMIALAIVYSLPRLVANMAAEEGVAMDQTYKISVGSALLVLEYCRQTFDFWPKNDADIELVNAAFSSINWPWLAKQAGEPKWKPPHYGVGWEPVTATEHREAVRHGREAERRYAEQERDAAAGA